MFAFRHTVKLLFSSSVGTLFTRLSALMRLAGMCCALLLDCQGSSSKMKTVLSFSYDVSVWYVNVSDQVKVCFVLLISVGSCSG